jgi:aryl-alcohol dehydrogenase-like predicted oxidoreductase
VDYRFLGETGVRVSELCLGTMSFGGSADEAASGAIFEAAREAGVNFFDTANVYNGGRSEEILGGLIEGCRDQVVVATKAYFPTGPGPNDRGSSRYHLVRAVEDSLRRLDTDRIDLLYVHRFDDRTGLSETLRALDDLVRSGKVLYLGASNFAAWQVMKALGMSRQQGWAPFVAIQPMYNLVKRQAEVELFPMARSEKLGVFPYSPLGAGLLTGKYGVNKRPESGRLVDSDQYRYRYGADAMFEVADAFTALAAEVGVHPVSLAIAWVGAQVTAPIIGARNVEQLSPAIDSVEVAMDDELVERISSLSAAPPPATDRNEEGTDFAYGAR